MIDGRRRRSIAASAITASAIMLSTSCVAPAAGPARSATIVAIPVAAPAPVPVNPRFSYVGPHEQGGALIGTVPVGAVSITFNGDPVPITPDGHFLVAFDRDAGPVAVLVAMMGDGRAPIVDTIAVAARAWNIERLNSLPRFALPSAAFDQLRAPELAQITAARRVNAPGDGWRQPFLWPVTGRLSGMFGSQRIYQNGEAGAYHSGTDIARPTGTPVVAPADGVVVLAADHPFTLEGNLLMIDHGMGLNSAFLHLSRIDVAVGDRVQRGQVIGAVGMTGRATGPHLHWSLRWRDARIDPLLMAGPMPGAE